MKKPAWVHIVGRKNSGKTTLCEQLIRDLRSRGYTVGTIKHSSHRHDVDQPGKDSWRHRQAGSAITALVSRDQAALFFTLSNAENCDQELSSHFSDCDFVLVEGRKAAPAGTRIEVWHSGVEEPPLCCNDSSIQWLLTQDQLPCKTIVPLISPEDALTILLQQAGERDV